MAINRDRKVTRCSVFERDMNFNSKNLDTMYEFEARLEEEIKMIEKNDESAEIVEIKFPTPIQFIEEIDGKTIKKAKCFAMIIFRRNLRKDEIEELED